MIELTPSLLRQLQKIELEMIIEVDRICRKHNIKYSLDGGTLLGAVRHKGFIPWDDDADVVMTRSEYEKFYEICKTELDTDRFFLQEFRTDKYYRWGYSKLRRKNTVFLREGQESGKWNQGVFLDIFVYDNVPDNPIIRRIHLFLCFCIRKGLYSTVGRYNAKSKLMRAWYHFLSLIPRKFWEIQISALAKLTNRKNGKLIRHMTYPYRRECRYGLPRKCFDEYQDIEYEGFKFRAFKDTDSYLSTLYGDYMKLPPIEKRKIHPVSQLKLI